MDSRNIYLSQLLQPWKIWFSPSVDTKDFKIHAESQGVSAWQENIVLTGGMQGRDELLMCRDDNMHDTAPV